MKTLVISYFFPPCTDGASTLMYNLLKNFPKEDYWAITAAGRSGAPFHPGQSLDSHDNAYSLDCNVTRLPPKSKGLLPRMGYVLLSVVNGFFLGLRRRFDCVLAVYPDETDLYAATILKLLLGIPLVIYMHDLYSEVRKQDRLYKLWRSLEKAVFAQSSMIIVTNDIFKNHYVKRGLKNVEVLPSCVSLEESAISSELGLPSNDKLRIVYSGSIYKANEDAILCFLQAAKKVSNTEVIFCTPYKKKYLEGVSVGFLSKAKCRTLQRSSDVLFLPLAFSCPYPEEIKVAFPCKSLEYLAVGRPTLAIVPPGSQAEEFVTKHGVGIVVNSLSEEKVVEAIERLKKPEVRQRFSKNAQNAVRIYDARVQAKNLIALLNKVVSRNSSGPSDT